MWNILLPLRSGPGGLDGVVLNLAEGVYGRMGGLDLWGGELVCVKGQSYRPIILGLWETVVIDGLLLMSLWLLQVFGGGRTSGC